VLNFICFAPISKACRLHLPKLYDWTFAFCSLVNALTHCCLEAVCFPFGEMYTMWKLSYHRAQTGLVPTHAYSVLDVKEVQPPPLAYRT
jgi:hypothetical protein